MKWLSSLTRCNPNVVKYRWFVVKCNVNVSTVAKHRGTLKKVLCRLKIPVRIRLLHCYIWPILLYGCEASTIKEDLKKRIEAFEMWAYRRMLAISWTQKVSYIEVLRRVNQKRQLLETVKKRKVAYLEHVLRHERYELLQLIMMEKVAGKKSSWSQKKVLVVQHPRMDGNRECYRALSPREEQDGVFEVDCQPLLVGEALEKEEQYLKLATRTHWAQVRP